MYFFFLFLFTSLILFFYSPPKHAKKQQEDRHALVQHVREMDVDEPNFIPKLPPKIIIETPREPGMLRTIWESLPSVDLYTFLMLLQYIAFAGVAFMIFNSVYKDVALKADQYAKGLRITQPFAVVAVLWRSFSG